MSGLANSWAGSFGFSYDALSRRTQMTRPNGISSNYSYDSLSRLLSVLHQAGGSTIDGAVYTVDAAGNRTSKADQLAGVTSNYAYDAIYQLTQVAQGANTTESYSYDAVGNRLSSLGVSPYSYNPSNEMTATPTAMYVYDANGNTTSKTDSTGTTQYAWDFENRLTSVTLPGSGGTVTLKYDPLGRRIEKISPTATSIFVYDDFDLIETVNATGGSVARYVQGQNIDEALATQQGTTTDYYEEDGLGSVTSLTAPTGALAQTYTYDSFGNTTNSSGSLTNFFRYTGREFDTETNLYYNRARYLDPTTGRFLSEDPIRFKGGVDFYEYGLNSPTNVNDPSGLCPPEGCQPPNTHNPQPRSKCSTYTDFEHRIACRELAGDDPVGQCVRGCRLDQYDTSKHAYTCDEAKLHCSCFDACGYSQGLRARIARWHFGCGQPAGPTGPSKQ